MFFNIFKHALSRGSIILTNQLTVLISIPILASRLDFFYFWSSAIGFVLVQLSWVVSDWVPPELHNLKTPELIYL